VALKASFDFKQLGKGGPCSIGLHEVGVFESHPLLAQGPRSPPEPAFQRQPPFLARGKLSFNALQPIVARPYELA
jgi:hypothetical protein